MINLKSAEPHLSRLRRELTDIALVCPPSKLVKEIERVRGEIERVVTLHSYPPCPFCGKDDTLVLISSDELYGNDRLHRKAFTIICDAQYGKGCGAHCGFHDTKELAVKMWNTRAEERNKI